MIEFITSWFLKAFSAFAPKKAGHRTGAAQIGGKSPAFQSDFFPNLRNFLLFSSPTYDLQPTTYCLSLPEAHLSLNRAILSLNQAILSLNRANLSLNQAHSLSPQSLITPIRSLIALSWRRIAPIFIKAA